MLSLIMPWYQFAMRQFFSLTSLTTTSNLLRHLNSKLLQILIMLFILLHSLQNRISTLLTILLIPLLIKFLIRFNRFLLQN
jgi:hypothetical protein